MADNRELIDQLRSVFFEEAEDGLAVIESGLLRLDDGDRDPELINSIFRAAHSIKGGSGTFGFTSLIDFTHCIETLLDRMRSGAHPIDGNTISILLKAVDQLRALLIAAMNGDDDEPSGISDAQAEVEALLRVDSSERPTDVTPAVIQAAPIVVRKYRIRFAPSLGLMRTGNDPLLMIRELRRMGRASVSVDTSMLPSFDELEPESFYLRFEVDLSSEATVEDIKDVFVWVEDEARIDVDVSEPETGAGVDAADDDEGLAAPTSSALKTPSAETKERAAPKNPDAGSIRVGIEKIDALINLVGELVITQSMLGQIEKTFEMSKLDRLRDGLSELERNARQLQESVMRIRMLPIRFVFSRFPRMVRDLSRKLDKQIKLTLTGENTELDKTVMEKIGDPLVHLLRNAMDHGIEGPAARREAGKDPEGHIEIDAYHQGGSIVIEVRDDGRGLNERKILQRAEQRGLVEPGEKPAPDRILDFIFHPGLSTAETVSDVSGRGVGLDVVRRNIRELGGHIEVASELGIGTTFTIRLPLTLAILDGQLVQIGRQVFVVPLVSIVETLEMEKSGISAVAGRSEVYRLRDEYIPIVRLYEVFGIEHARTHLDGALLMLVEGGGHRAGIVVDDLLDQQQVVIKSLESNFRQVDGISGATILGDGTVALILDVGGLINFASRRASRSVGFGGDEARAWS